jgi:hypothetical protein
MSSEYKIVRTYSGGVFLAKIESRNGREAVLRDAKRLCYPEIWISLSQLAVDGHGIPENCKFTVAVDRIEIFEIIEILDVTPEAKSSIDQVPIWKI